VKTTPIFFLLIIFFFCSNSILAQSENEEVLKTVQHFFDALAARDTVFANQVFINDGQLFSIQQDSSGIKYWRRTQTDFGSRLVKGTSKIKEVMREPEVLVHNQIAIVWTPYEFYIEDEYSHKGVDAFSLINTDQGWKIVSIIYTIER
jgi:hypothetical protein